MTGRSAPCRRCRAAAVLEVDDLAVTFTRKGEAATRAVDGVSFAVAPGETSAWSGSPAAASR